MLPWVSIETSPIGTARPCCLAIDEITKPDGTKYDLNETNLTEIYKSEYMQQLRQQFRQGESLLRVIVVGTKKLRAAQAKDSIVKYD